MILKTGVRLPIDKARQAMVDQALWRWSNKLIDLSRRNNLLYFRTLKKGTLNLTKHHVEIMEQLWQATESHLHLY